MPASLDYILNTTRSILRAEAQGSAKLLAAAFMAISLWSGVLLLRNWTAQSFYTLSALQARFRTLLTLGNEFISIAPNARNSSGSTLDVDVAAVFALVSENLKLGSRVNRISPDGRNQAVEINRLYAEEFTELQRQLASRGVRFIAAELRALPAGNERLFTVSAIIGPVN